ncbi:MAG: conjugal transfer protein TraF [Bacilli bacterium]|nr:conjugal transfer protein TraF [Bacilli bacterium]
MSKSEKYGLIGILTLLVVVIVISCFVKVKPQTGELSNDGDVIFENAQKESSAVADAEKGDFVQIDINQYMEMYNGTEKQLVLIARPTCTYCQIAEPIIQNIIYKYNVTVNYLNTDDLDENGEETLTSSNEALKDVGTPTLLVVSEGTIHNTVDGLTDTAHYEQFMKDNGFIE